MHGTADPVAPVEHIRDLALRFPGLTLHELRGGHHLYLTYPRLVNRLIAAAA